MEVEMGGGEHQGMHLPSRQEGLESQAQTVKLFQLSIPATRIVTICLMS
jgi:hypothetical protein